jgi:hypothetical protein
LHCEEELSIYTTRGPTFCGWFLPCFLHSFTHSYDFAFGLVTLQLDLRGPGV